VQFIEDTFLEQYDSETFQFIVVARLVAIKNLVGLIKAFHLVEYKKKSLTIVGDGPDRERLMELVQVLNISHQVFFYGYQCEVMSYLFKADCFVLPSFSEGSSVALAEAMLAELPSIVTEIGGAAEILGNSNSSIFINPYDLVSLKNAMESMVKIGGRERREMGIRARQYALENFSPARHADRLLDLYSGLYGKN
jgi:glycosyltransferase involved in cell wall biosynthesis